MLALNRKRHNNTKDNSANKREKKHEAHQIEENENSGSDTNERDKYFRKLIGNFFIVGFEGTSVNTEISTLISKYHVSSIILAGRNFVNASQAKNLIKGLQVLAKKSGYKYPIIFVIDEEGGMLNSLFDGDYVTQFPGAMSMGAAGSTDLAYKVYRAMAKELKSIGFSMYLGPVLDILKNTSNTFIQQMIGVRSYGYDAEFAVKMGKVAAKAFRDENMSNCGKHFPGYGSATINSNFELPMISESEEQLFESSLVPYMELFKEDVLDSVLVGGCAVPAVNNNDLHACLSPTIVTNILREKLGFNGVVISECLLLEALDRNFGVFQGCISAFSVGCDLIMLCSNFDTQNQAIMALKSVVEDQLISPSIVNKSLERIQNLQKRLPSWEEVITTGFLTPDILTYHKLLSKKTYEKSITIIRDSGLPISKYLMANVENENTILLLTPLISPLYETVNTDGVKTHINSLVSHDYGNLNLNYGEDVFIKLGELLASYKPGYKVFHTSYNSNGLTSFHENLILKSKVILFFCAETTNNLYQVGVSKHVLMLCNSMTTKIKNSGRSFGSKKMIIISVASPTDFLYDINLGGSPTGYICTYDYTINALCNLPKILFGDFKATGKIPGISTNALLNGTVQNTDNKHRNHSWLVEVFNYKRDWENLVNLLKNNNYLDYSVMETSLTSLKRIFFDTKNHRSFVVRNTSSNTILGISSVWVYSDTNISDGGKKANVANLMLLLVDRNKRNISIGNHLYSKSVKYLFEERACSKIYLGRNFPKLTVVNDLLLNFTEENNKALNFFKSFGCDFSGETVISEIKSRSAIKNTSPFTIGVDNSSRISVNTLLADSMKINKEGNKQSNSQSFDTTFELKINGINGSSFSNENINFIQSDALRRIHEEFTARLLNRTLKRQVRYLMRLDDISSWQVAENLVRQLQVVGIMFDICKNPGDILSSQKGKNSNSISLSNESDIYDNDDISQLTEFANNSYEVYLELFNDFCLNDADKQYFDGSGNLDIIVALEPTKRYVVGSLVVFNGKSKFSKFYPFLESQGNGQRKSAHEFACITGHFIDPLYTTLSEVFKLGLICTALMYVKGQYRNCSECFITDIDEKQIRSLHDNGFKTVEKYCNYYSVISEE